MTGESPIVDVVNNRAQFVANRDILDAIPTPIRNTPLRALLLPGTAVTPFVLGQYTMSVHGSNSSDTVIAVDGMRVNYLCGSGQQRVLHERRRHRRDHFHDRCGIGRNAERRIAHQQHPQGRGKHVLGFLLRLLRRVGHPVEVGRFVELAAVEPGGDGEAGHDFVLERDTV